MTLTLWTAATPNGWKISIMLEELKEAGIDLPPIAVRSVDLFAGDQFSDAFRAICPNQKIPALLHNGCALMESGAILQYLAETFPSPLMPQGDKRWQVLQWLIWQVANIGPVFGNKLSYTRYMDHVDTAKKQHPLERFETEAQRLLAVFSHQLADQPYLCGDAFTIADIACYPWIRGWKWSKIDINGYTNITAWLKRVRARPGVDRGLKYGIADAEVDHWSAATKAQYAQLGTAITALPVLRQSVPQ
ncbi:MAG: glutathione binding-like protein [Pseudomonadota bacterium]